MKVALTSGAYTARSVIASAQRCVNLYPEQNPEDAPFPTTHYPTPGLRLLAAAPTTGWRCLYSASNGVLYGVCGQAIYRIGADWALTEIGTMPGTGPAWMVDNGSKALIVDGSSLGRVVDLATSTVTPVSNAAFYGSTRVDLVDGYLLLNRPGTEEWYISLFREANWDALDFAAKTGFSDKVVAVMSAKRQVYVFGKLTTEVWFNSGAADFPFERMPGAFMHYGCEAAGSIARLDGTLYWLSRSPEGRCMVVRAVNYEAQRVSTHAIEQEIAGYGDVSDVIAYSYQQDGHVFYVLTFPGADRTWVFDLATGQWHERAWSDDQGALHRHRSNCFAHHNGAAVVGDWETGSLYALDQGVYSDNGAPILRIRSFPHMLDDGNRVMYRELIASMEVGRGIPSSFESPELRLRWSDTAGQSWGTSVSVNLGATGDYLKSLQFQRLGYARDRVFELSWSAPARTALNGVFLRVEGANE